MPYGARARAERLLGDAQDRLGRHDLARRAYAAALADAPADDALQTREQVHDAERQKIDPRAAESYRLSLEGWRAFERGAKSDAAAALEQALALAPDDSVARYRYARVLAARGDTARATRRARARHRGASARAVHRPRLGVRRLRAPARARRRSRARVDDVSVRDRCRRRRSARAQRRGARREAARGISAAAKFLTFGARLCLTLRISRP